MIFFKKSYIVAIMAVCATFQMHGCCMGNVMQETQAAQRRAEQKRAQQQAIANLLKPVINPHELATRDDSGNYSFQALQEFRRRQQPRENALQNRNASSSYTLSGLPNLIGGVLRSCAHRLCSKRKE